jgi:hypothetical protein
MAYDRRFLCTFRLVEFDTVHCLHIDCLRLDIKDRVFCSAMKLCNSLVEPAGSGNQGLMLSAYGALLEFFSPP